MRLLLDMDGPLADFDQKVWDLCGQMGWPLHLTDLQDPRRKRFLTDNMSPHQSARLRAHINETRGWFRELSVTAGAVDGVAALKAAGIDIWVCTKPLEANPSCRDDKGAWLREHFPQLENKLIIAPDKSLIHGDVLLDDAPKLSWFSDATWRPVIFPSVFNGPGSEWDGLPSWGWSDPISDLINHLRGGVD